MSIIKITEGRARNPKWSLSEPVNFELDEGEHIAIVGRNGAGKTMLVDMITSRHPVFPQSIEYNFGDDDRQLVSDNIKYISFRDTYGGDNDRNYFLQQRWNQMEIDEETPTVEQKLEEAYMYAGADTPDRRDLQRHIYSLFHLETLLDKYIILLSSGELRKFKLATALLSNPRVLIMDNPFIGLDAETRDQLRDLLGILSRERSLQIILVLSKTDEIPDFITHVVEVEQMAAKPKATLEDYLAQATPYPTSVLTDDERKEIMSLGNTTGNAAQEEVISFNDVSIRYGSRTILSQLNWHVNTGEHWVLAGQNGSGKSTLLSLVTADNPQAYACDIRLFGHKRGTGESIWDIKRQIGYVSPEMHRSYQRDLPAMQIVGSGLKDSIGLYAKTTEEEKETCRFWMRMFGVESLADRSFMQMSSGEQRLMLLARAFVKDPQLLILDEPLHGLDNVNRRRVKDVIETFSQRPGKTLIFVSHYREEWPSVIDHEIFLQRH